MYKFVDTNETSEGAILPSEALRLNGEYIEELIPGYRTLTVSGREALSPELLTVETGIRDGARLKNRRYPARIIVVKYQLLAASNEAFRAAFNKLGGILNVEDAEMIFNDEQDKFFIGTPSAIGEVPPGTNSVVGEIQFTCVDPFKYSVIEYEAVPNLDENTILIDYNGTHKAFPTLEAEFYNEDENEATLTGSGDCGYVAFFNEDEKIIQLGNPDEIDTEGYAKSQTLVNQKFNTETSWGKVAETNWAHNSGKLPYSDLVQSGNVDISVAHYETTIAPVTSGTLLTKRSTQAKPYVDYKVTAKTTGRTADSVNVSVTITTTPVSSGSSGVATISAGAQVTLNNTNIYVSSDAKSKAGTRSGIYYLWDASVINNRIRITNSRSNVGKSGKVTAWVNVSDIGASAAGSFGNGLGLIGSIQFNGGDWYSATIKGESAKWDGKSGHNVTLSVKVKNIDADTIKLEDIKFKVERTDDEDNKIGLLDETICNDFEISTYTAPVPGSWYLLPETYGTATGWHGPAITRTIPADASGEVGAKNFKVWYKQKMAIGSGSAATQEVGAFMALLTSGSGANRKIVAGVDIIKSSSGSNAQIRFFVNNKEVNRMTIDLSLNNKMFGNNSTAKGITTIKGSTIEKMGEKIVFDVGGVKKTFVDAGVKDVATTEMTFYWGQYGTKPTLSYNGLYAAKLIKNNCDTWQDIPNKFSANDVVIADCKNGEIFLNDTPTPSLGALGNDWEDFYLTPGLNQIGFSYSDWVDAEYAPSAKIRYREVFL